MNRIQVAWLTEQSDDDGSTVLIGYWGDAKLIVEPTDQTSRGGHRTWRMMLAPSPREKGRNVSAAQRRIALRKADAAGASE